MEEFGVDGYGVFWICCELIAQQGQNYQINNNKNWKKALTKITKIPSDNLERIIIKLGELNLIDKKALEENCLFIPKMEEYSDDYTKKQRRMYGQCTDNVRTISEQCTDNVRLHNSTVHNSTVHNNTVHNITKENTYTPDFEEFWKEYPKKIGKRNTYKSWNKINAPLVVILKAIKEQKNSRQWKEDDGKYIPHPSTWLNQGRWEDEIKVAPRKVIDLRKNVVNKT